MARKGKYKIHIEEELYNELMETLRKADPDLADKIEDHTKEPGATLKHHIALQNIGFKKQEQTEAKIENAVRLLMMEQKEPTIYAVAKTAGISYNTAKKYAKEIEYFARMTW